MYAGGSIIMTIVPFLCYYLGIIIRKVVIPGVDSPSLGKQLLLGIPISLVVVTPLLAAFLHLQANTDITALLVMIGTIIEQGMIMNETATKILANLVRAS
jgi:hypothetical protein